MFNPVKVTFEVPILFSAPSGSLLYGTSIPGSDEDWINIYMPTIEMAFAEVVPPAPHTIIGNKDERYWSLPKFLKLLTKGDMVALETWSCFKGLVDHQDMHGGSFPDGLMEVYRTICRWPAFYRANISNTISEYLRSVCREQYGEISFIDPRRDTTGKNMIRNILAPSGRWVLGGQKMYHFVRIVTQALEIFQTGTLIFPGQYASDLVKVRHQILSASELLCQIQEKTPVDQWLSVFGLLDTKAVAPITWGPIGDIKQAVLDNLFIDIQDTMRWINREKLLTHTRLPIAVV